MSNWQKTVVEQRGFLPCKKCGRPHDMRATVVRGHKNPTVSWADPDDGHYYEKVNAEDYARELADANQSLLSKLAQAREVLR